MANEEHLALLRQGIDVWNQWRKENSEVRPNLRGVNFSKAILIDADLSGADLRGANLRESDLGKLPSGVYGIARVGPPQFNKFDNPFAEVSLSGVDLRGADLRDANLSEVNLRGANLRGADLSKADLSEANLSEQVFADFYFSGAVFSKANLSQADLNGIDLSKAELSGANLNEANLSRTNLSGANLSGASFDKAIVIGANFSRANLSKANLSRVSFSNINFCRVDLREADLSRAFLCQSDFSKADLSGANLSEANLSLTKLNKATLAGANLIGANLAEAILSEANLNEADLSLTRALGTNFSGAHFTGTCLEDWNINSATNLDDVICDYIYLRKHQQERRPSSGTFAPGDFTKYCQKALETVDLIFRDGIDWDAFAYSFKRVEVENEGAQLNIQSIEKKGNGVLVVRVNVSPDADKNKIHSYFMQGYELARRALEEQYQARLEDKDKHINQLVYLLHQSNENQGEVLKRMSEAPKYDMRNSSFQGGFAEANYGKMVETQINYATQQNLAEAAAEIQQLLTQLQTKEYSPEEAQQQVAIDLAKQAQSDPTVKDKLVRWGKYLGDAAANGIIGDVAVKVIKLAIGFAGIPMA